MYTVSLPAGDSTVILVASREGLFRSVDAGASWQATDLPAAIRLRVLATSAARPERVYGIATRIGTEDRFWISNDGGQRWSVAAQAPSGLLDIAIDPTDPSVLYAAAATGGFHQSTNAGQTWTRLDGPPRSFSIFVSEDRNVLYGEGEGGLLKTADGSRSWPTANPVEPVGTLVPRPDGAEHVPMVDPSGSPFFFGAVRAQSGTLYACLSADWFSFGPEDIEAYAVAQNTDERWSSLPLPAPQSCDTLAVDPGAPGTVYAGGRWNLQRTWDGGQSWTDIPMFNGLQVYTITTESGRPRSDQATVPSRPLATAAPLGCGKWDGNPGRNTFRTEFRADAATGVKFGKVTGAGDQRVAYVSGKLIW